MLSHFPVTANADTISMNERRDLMHCCSVTQLQSKEVINTKNGCRIGFVSDVEIDMHEGRLCAILVDVRRKGGLFSKEPDLRIPWDDIAVLGEDTILVRCTPPERPQSTEKSGLFSF